MGHPETSEIEALQFSNLPCPQAGALDDGSSISSRYREGAPGLS